MPPVYVGTCYLLLRSLRLTTSKLSVRGHIAEGSELHVVSLNLLLLRRQLADPPGVNSGNLAH